MQDDITLSPEKLILTLGVKLENNDYTGVEVPAQYRLLWTPTEASTFWGAISKASRTPSRIDRGGVVNQTVLAPMSAQNPLPFPILLQGTGVVDSESLVAYEAGWKHRLSRTFNFDLATYYNDYDKLRSIRFDAPLCQPAGIPVSPACFFPVSQALRGAAPVSRQLEQGPEPRCRDLG
ncbi:MAG: TonB-dependent receptor [Betaproteobacteria bacterium]|nr:TonB-dependent receptor [Betaproteobacteria bacterium]